MDQDVSGLFEGLIAAMRAFDTVHGEGAAARELFACAAIFCGSAIVIIGLAAIGEGL